MQQVLQDTMTRYTSEKLLDKKKNAEVITEQRYRELHTKNLVPLDITIDVDQFMSEISKYDSYFKYWDHRGICDIERYGLPLVNMNGKIDNTPEPMVGSLTQWNMLYPEEPYIDIDFTTPTEIMQLDSIQPLKRYFDGHWSRSNILKWGVGGRFDPHIDNKIPAYWYRLWGTTNTDSYVLAFYDEATDSFIKEENIEPGRIYLIDTAKTHIASSSIDLIYQYFISVKPSAYETIKKLMI